MLELNAASCDKYKKLNSLKNISEKNFLSKSKLLFNKLNIERRIKLKGDLLVASEEIRKDISTLTNPYSPKTEEIEQIIKKHL